MAAGPSAAASHADTLVGCDTAKLVTAIANANSSGGGILILTAGCTYTLKSGPYGDGNGADGLPVITSAITIHGNGATITRDHPPRPSVSSRWEALTVSRLFT